MHSTVQMLAKQASHRITSKSAAAHGWFDDAARQAVERILAVQEPVGEEVVQQAVPATVEADAEANVVSTPVESKCCVKVEGPGHASLDNDANYFLYARVVNMPSVCSYQVSPPKMSQTCRNLQLPPELCLEDTES